MNSSEYTSKNWLIFLVSEIVIHLRLTVLLGGVFLLAACGPAATPAHGATTGELRATATPQAAASLEGTEWVLVSLQGSSPLAGTHIWLAFMDEQARGFAGCNQYGGPYAVTGMDALTFQELAITEQACLEPEGVMEQETVYMAALRIAVAYRLAGDRLEIQDAAGETVLAFDRQPVYPGDPAGLVGTAWRLASLDGQALIAGSALTMAFHDGHLVSGHAGCRDYLATYQAAGGDLAFTYSAMLGPVCAEDALLEEEGAYTTALGWTAHYRLAQDKLELFTVRGETLTFAPLPTEAQSTLEGPTWSLLAFIEPNPYGGSPYPPPLPGDVLAGSEITAKFADGAMRGSTGRNSYNGAYNQEGDSLAIGPTAVTEMACLEPAGVMEQEGRFLDLLASVTVHHVYGDQLWLEADDGRALVFRARLPEGGSMPCTEPAPTLAGLIL